MGAIVKKSAGKLAKKEQWESEMEAEARADAANFQTGTARITHKSGILKVDGEKVKDNKLVCAIVSAIKSKAYYEGAYDPEVPQTPACYAFHPTQEAEMVPHPESTDKQAERCLGCQHNRFGTAEKGNGKRCKDEVRLMVVIPTGDDVGSERRMMSIPPGSLKNWGQYLSKLRDMGASYRGRLTIIETEENEDAGAYRLTFTPGDKLDAEQYGALKEMAETAAQESMQPYPVLEADERPRRPAKKNKKIKGQD